MFMRVLSAMMAADWIDRQMRARQEREHAEQQSRNAAYVCYRDRAHMVRRDVRAPRPGWDLQAPERPL